jgi:ABC-type uncharacterized transport system permease subunit
MKSLIDVLFALTCALYLSAAVLFGVHLAGRRADTRLPSTLMSVATALHAVHIVVFSWLLHACPVEGVHFPLSVAAMLMSAAYLAGKRFIAVDAVGAVIAPLALTALLASRFVAEDTAAGPRLKSVMLPFHVTMNLVGIALFSFASASALLYLLQEKRMKAKLVSRSENRLPPLDTLDRAGHRFLIAGFPLLTLGIVTGTVWAAKIQTGSFADNLRTALGYATWGLVATVLLLRASAGWRGRRAAYGTLASFGCAVLVLLVYWLRGGGA